jgi:hypothetical protein
MNRPVPTEKDWEKRKAVAEKIKQRKKRENRKERFTVAQQTRRQWNDAELRTLADTEYARKLVDRSVREVKLEDDPLNVDEYKRRVYSGVMHDPALMKLVHSGTWYQRFKERRARGEADLESEEMKNFDYDQMMEVFKPLPEMLDHGNFIGPTYHPHVVHEGWKDDDFEGASDSSLDESDHEADNWEKERQRRILIHQHEKYWPEHD